MAPIRALREEEERQRAIAEACRRAAAAKRRAAQLELERKRDHFLQYIRNLYGDAVYAYREEDEQLKRYALQHKQMLNQRSAQIVAAYQYFHSDVPWEGTDFVDYLKRRFPGLYLRVEEVFQYRALAIARKPKQKHRRQGNRADEKLSRAQRVYDDRTMLYREMAFRRHATERDFIDDLAEMFPHLTEDELQAELQRFRDEFEGSDDAYHGGASSPRFDEY
jgi:phage shock protein A